MPPIRGGGLQEYRSDPYRRSEDKTLNGVLPRRTGGLAKYNHGASPLIPESNDIDISCDSESEDLENLSPRSRARAQLEKEKVIQKQKREQRTTDERIGKEPVSRKRISENSWKERMGIGSSSASSNTIGDFTGRLFSPTGGPSASSNMIKKTNMDFGPLEWKNLSESDMVPRGFEFRMNVHTGQNYAKVPRRLRLPQKNEEYVKKLCALASWGGPTHLAELRAELDSFCTEKEGRIVNPPVDCLAFAVEQGHFDVIDLLLDKKASCVQFDKEQQTPLHVACKAGNEDVLAKLFLYHKDLVSTREGKKMKERVMMGSGSDLVETSMVDKQYSLVDTSSKSVDSCDALDAGSVESWSAQACFLRLENGNGKTPKDILLEQDLGGIARRVADYIGCGAAQ